MSITSAQESQQQLEQRYRLMIEEASDGIFIMDYEARYIDVNNSGCAMLGYSKSEILRMSVHEVLPEGVRPIVMQKDRELLAGEVLVTERLLKKKDGSFLHAEVSFKMLPDGNVMGITRNITERKLIEEKFRKSQEDYASLVNTVDGIVWEADARTFRFSFVSRQAERLLGYPPEQWINEPSFWVDHIVEQDRDFAVNYSLNSTREKKNYEFEYRMRAGDGRIVWLRDIVSIVLEKGEPVQLRGIMIDITEKKKAEEKINRRERQLMASFENTPNVAIQWYNNKGEIKYWNHASELMYGWSALEAVGKTLHQLFYNKEDAAVFLETIHQVEKSGQTIGPSEFPFHRRNGLAGVCIATIFQIPSIDGEPYFACMDVDITESREAGQALKASEEKYRSLVENAPDIILVLNLDYTVEFVNYTVGGYTKQEVVGKNISHFLPPDYQQEVIEILDRVVGLKKPITYETFGYDADGKTRWYLTNAGPIISEDKVTGITLMVRDNTSRKNAEKEMARTKELLEETSYVSGVGGWEVDPVSNKASWTTGTREIHQVSPGYTPHLEASINFFKEGECRKIASDAIREAMQEGKPFDFESIIITAKGNERWVRAKGRPEFNNKKCVRLFGTFQDIHDNKIKEIKEKSRTRILELLNANASLPEILEALVKGAEQTSPGMLCSILLLDEDGKKLRLGAGPSLPEFYNQAIDGVVIGPSVGSCGTAAYTGERVIVENIQEHPFWERYRMLAEKAGLMACWSEPVKDTTGKVLGTFASYYTRNASPSKSDIENLKQAADLALIVLEKFRSAEFIKQSEERFRSLVQNISDIITVLDENGYIQFESPSIKNILGFEEEELVGKHIFELLHPDDIAHVKETFENALKIPGMTPPVLFRIINKTGGYSSLEARGNNQLHNPSVRSVIVTSRDVSERLQTEEILRQSEKKYRTLIEQATDAILVADMDGRFQIVNESCARLSGYTTEELLTMRFHDFSIKEEIEKNPFRFEELLQGKNLITERGMKNKAGELIDIEINARIMEDGRLLIFIRNITYRKKAAEEILKSNARFQVLSKATSDIVWDWDLIYDAIWYNDNYYKSLGIVKLKELTDIDEYYSRIHADDVEKVKAGIQSALAGSGDIWKEEYRCNTTGGYWLYFLDRGFIIRNKEGRPIRMVGSIVDITEKIKSEEKIKQNLEQLLTLSKLSEAVSKANKPEDIYELAIQSLKQTIKADRASVLLFDEAGIMQFVASSGLSDKYKKAASGHSPWTPEEKDPVPFFIPNAASDPSLAGLLPVIKKEGICALGFIPLVYKGVLLGKFMLYFNTEHHFTDEEIHLAKTIAKDVAFAIGEKESEIFLRESEIRMRTILDTDPECIKLMGPGCELFEINRGGLQMIEADSLDQVKGHSILPVVLDDYKKAAQNLVKEAFEGRSGRLEFEMNTLKGNHRWCEINIVPFRNSEGKIINALGVTRDITERKKAEKALKFNEEKYSTLVEQAIDAIALYDRSGKVLDVNTGSADLLGYTKGELIGMSIGQILTEEELRDNPVRFDVLEEGKSTVKERKFKRKDGSVVHTEVRSQMLPDGRFLSIIRDLTERIVAKEELEASYKAVRKLTSHLQNIREEERKHIAREIHDELGQQLTVLKMDISWLSKKISPHADIPVKQKIKELLTMLDGTVKTVRRISSELRPSLLDDLGLLAAMEWQLGEFEKRSGIKTSFIEPDKEVQLADHVKTGLFRIFQESLTNVARHADARKVKVSFLSAGNDFVLRISDDGKGFDKHKVAEKKTLGILGMKERTAMIGGTYTISSAPEKGTSVIVTIPMDS